MRIVDLTHALSPDIPGWDPGSCVALQTLVDYDGCTPPNPFRVQKIEAKCGAGTHIDAPAHCIPGAKTVDELDLESLRTRCVVIHVDDKADATYNVSPEDIERFEREHGEIASNAFVIFYTGWDKHWQDPRKYRNDLQFPGIHEDTAKLLLQRNIAGIGIDTLSPDASGKDFPVHRVLLGAGKVIVENVANASHLPVIGADVMIAPMKIAGGTEASVRMMAFLP